MGYRPNLGMYSGIHGKCIITVYPFARAVTTVIYIAELDTLIGNYCMELLGIK